MRALQLISPGKIEVRDVPVPEIASDEVLVKVAGAGLCHSDLHCGARAGMAHPEHVLGHETAGHIEPSATPSPGSPEGTRCSSI